MNFYDRPAELLPTGEDRYIIGGLSGINWLGKRYTVYVRDGSGDAGV